MRLRNREADSYVTSYGLSETRDRVERVVYRTRSGICHTATIHATGVNVTSLGRGIPAYPLARANDAKLGTRPSPSRTTRQAKS